MNAGEKYMSYETNKAKGHLYRSCIQLKEYLGGDLWLIDLWLLRPEFGLGDNAGPIELSGAKIHKYFYKIDNFRF